MERPKLVRELCHGQTGNVAKSHEIAAVDNINFID
jgi:hypothetical protein